MTKKKMFLKCAKLLNFSILFQGLSDLLLIAIPTFTAYLTGEMLNYILYMDITKIKTGLIPFLIAIFIAIFIEPLISMLDCIIIFKQSLRNDEFTMKSFLCKDYLDAKKLTEGAFQERMNDDLVNYRFLIIFIISQPFVILIYGIEVIYMLSKSSGSLLFLITVLLSASMPMIRTIIKGKFDAIIKKKEYEYLEKKRTYETIMYDSHDFLKASNIGHCIVDKTDKEFKNYIKSDGKTKFRLESSKQTIDFFSNHAMKIIVLIVGCILISKKMLAVGSLFSALLILPSLRKWYGYIKRLIYNCKKLNILTNRVYYLFENHDSKKQDISEFKEIHSDNISFKYTEEKIILKNLNITIENSQKYIIVGPNGTGKTTLLRLLSGILKPVQGNFILDKNKILTNSTLQNITSYNSQESYLFKGTLLENITFNNKIPTNKIQKTLNCLGLEKYSLETAVKEGGNNFSVGEKHKISLARTILKDSEFILLDEPTNHVDNECVDYLINFITTTNKTILIVSHDNEFVEKLNGVCKTLQM